MDKRLTRLRGQYDDVTLARHVGPLLEMSRQEAEAYIAELEAPLIAELEQLHEQPLPLETDRERRREITQQRAYIGRIWSLWKDLHRPDDAGPNQGVNV